MKNAQYESGFCQLQFLCWCLILLQTVVLAVPLPAQQSAPSPDWRAWQFLLGDWVGEGSGAPGEAVGGFSIRYDLQQRILVRNNFADYPATPEHPAFTHNDLMIIYQQNGTPRAIYFDNEGHVIHYTVAFSSDTSSVVFISEPMPSAPRFCFTYTKTALARIKIQFDIARLASPRRLRRTSPPLRGENKVTAAPAVALLLP